MFTYTICTHAAPSAHSQLHVLQLALYSHCGQIHAKHAGPHLISLFSFHLTRMCCHQASFYVLWQSLNCTFEKTTIEKAVVITGQFITFMQLALTENHRYNEFCYSDHR